jgi:hypothetical protein
LLAIPQYLVIALFVGGATYVGWQSGEWTFQPPVSGLIDVLGLVAAVVLARQPASTWTTFFPASSLWPCCSTTAHQVAGATAGSQVWAALTSALTPVLSVGSMTGANSGEWFDGSFCTAFWMAGMSVASPNALGSAPPSSQ